jgi:hypothetical protein
MSDSKKLDKSILETFKIKHTLMDFIKATYKPVMPIYKPNDKKSEEENIVSEEYTRLVFYMKKIKNIFNTLKHSMKELTGLDNINLSSQISTIIETLDKNVGESLEKIFNYKYFKLFLTVSTIPINTEFYYLGEIDTVDLDIWINEFDLIFKQYIEIVLKQSIVVSE